MRYYSLQDLGAWDHAQQAGFLTGNPAYTEPDWRGPYAWLVAQMQARLGLTHDFWPVWMWDERPDLRQSHWRSRETQVLLALDVNPDLVLASDYESWHAPLNDCALLRYEDEVIEKELSWARIFDFQLLRSDPAWFGDPTLQFTTPSVPVGQIKVLHYLAPRKKPYAPVLINNRG